MQHAPSSIKLIEQAGAGDYLRRRRHLLAVSRRHQQLTVVWSRLKPYGLDAIPPVPTAIIVTWLNKAPDNAYVLQINTTNVFTPWHKHNFLSLPSAQAFYWVSLTRDFLLGLTDKRLFTGLTTRDFLLGLTDKRLFTGLTTRDFLLGLTDKRLFTGSHWQETFYWVSLTRDFLLGFTERDAFYWVLLKERLFTGSHWKRDFLLGLSETNFLLGLTETDTFTRFHWNRDFLLGLTERETLLGLTEKDFLLGLTETDTFTRFHWNSETFYRGNTPRLLLVHWDG